MVVVVVIIINIMMLGNTVLMKNGLMHVIIHNYYTKELKK
jgi:hypothetical protein